MTVAQALGTLMFLGNIGCQNGQLPSDRHKLVCQSVLGPLRLEKSKRAAMV